MEVQNILLGIGRNKRTIDEKISLIAQEVRKAEGFLSNVVVCKSMGLFLITIQSEKPEQVDVEYRQLTPDEYVDKDLFDLLFEL